MTKRLSKTTLAEAVSDVQCSVHGNMTGDPAFWNPDEYLNNARISATDWLNERKLGDDGKVDQIVAGMMKAGGYS